jgi:hypothetical protein
MLLKSVYWLVCNTAFSEHSNLRYIQAEPYSLMVSEITLAKLMFAYAKVWEVYRLLGARPRLPPPAKIGAIPV